MHSLLLVLAAACAADPADGPDCWPAFQGVGASAVTSEQVPLHWSPNSNLAWKRSLVGRGQSSPVIWGSLAFVTSIDGVMKERCHVTAIRLRDGAVAWQQEIAATQQIRSNYFQSRSAPTPVVDRDRVYAFFETGECVAFTHTGQRVWQRSLTTDYGPFEGTIGIAASPVQTADSLILLIDHEGPSYLLSLRKSTGETRWQTERASRVSWATPALVPVGTGHHLVCSSAGTVDGYDPSTGTPLWTFDGVGGNRHSTPLPLGPGRFLVGASPGMHGERELEARKSNFAMQIKASGSGFTPQILWGSDKAMPSFGSPVVHRGHAYWVNKVGVVYCFDVSTGEQRYAQRIKQSCWITPVGVGDRLYCFGKDGITTVLAAGPSFKILAENSLWDGAWETPQRTDLSEGQGGNRRRREPAPAPSKSSAAADAGDSTGAADPASAANETNRRGASGAASRGASSAPAGRLFADPIQYGVALVNGSLLIRTGEVVYCLREPPTNPSRR